MSRGALEERGFEGDWAMIGSVIKESGKDMHSAKAGEESLEAEKATG